MARDDGWWAAEIERKRSLLRASLERLRDRHRRVLEFNSYEPDLGEPGRLDPKSPAWRSRLAAAKPLKKHEQSDLSFAASIADRWLGLVNDCDAALVAILLDALELAKVESRIQSELWNRVMAPDAEDASRFRKTDMAQLRAGKKKQGRTKAMRRVKGDDPTLSDGAILKADFDRRSAERAVKKSRASDLSLRETIGKARGLSEDTVRRRIASVSSTKARRK